MTQSVLLFCFLIQFLTETYIIDLFASLRYHAAIILKKSCLTHLVLGDILQILHVIVTFKKWITTHSSDWQPISITLAEANGEAGAKYIT